MILYHNGYFHRYSTPYSAFSNTVTWDEDFINKIHFIHLILFLFLGFPDLVWQVLHDRFFLFFSETSANLKTLSLSQQTGPSRGKSKTDGGERDGQGRGVGVQATRSLFRKTLEATGNSTLHFSCQTPAGLMACSQRVVRQRDAVAGPEMWKQCRSRWRLSPQWKLPYVPLESRPPELLKPLNVLWQQINMSHLSESKYSRASFQRETWNMVSIIRYL